MSPLDGLSHVAVVSADLDRLARFYVEVFDATLLQVEELPTGRLGIVRLAAGAGLNIFELAVGDLHVAGLPAMFARGHIDHVGLPRPRRRHVLGTAGPPRRRRAQHR